MKWAVGITVVDQRLRDGLLVKSLASLANGGFNDVRLFVDNPRLPQETYTQFKKHVTFRIPRIGAFGNWILGLGELYIRNTEADYYCIFQDDILCVRNLRQYLERERLPQGYFNLFTTPNRPQDVMGNQELVDVRDKGKMGWFQTNQNGLGALGLVIPNRAVRRLLSHTNTINKPSLIPGYKSYPDQNIDGLVAGVLAQNKGEFPEYCHNPSLLQHTGLKSTIGHTGQPLAMSFPGEEFDAISLPLQNNVVLRPPTLRKIPPRRSPTQSVSSKQLPTLPVSNKVHFIPPPPPDIRLAQNNDPFLGMWHIYQKNGTIKKTIYLHVDGSSKLGPVVSLKGKWSLYKGIARVEWDDDSKDTMTLVAGGCINMFFRKGTSWESAPAESLLGTLKHA